MSVQLQFLVLIDVVKVLLSVDSSTTLLPDCKCYSIIIMQAKCANFVLCSRDFSTKVCSKVCMKFHDVRGLKSTTVSYQGRFIYNS